MAMKEEWGVENGGEGEREPVAGKSGEVIGASSPSCGGGKVVVMDDGRVRVGNLGCRSMTSTAI